MKGAIPTLKSVLEIMAPDLKVGVTELYDRDAIRIIIADETGMVAWFEINGMTLSRCGNADQLCDMLDPLLEEARFSLEWMKDDDDSPAAREQIDYRQEYPRFDSDYGK